MEPRRLAPRASHHASQPSLGPPPLVIMLLIERL